MERINLDEEPFLTGLLKEELTSFSSFDFEKLGEFPLVEGSFRNLIEIGLPHRISSLDDKNLHVLEFIFVVFYRSWNFMGFC